MRFWEELAATLVNELEDDGVPPTAENFECALRACDRHARWTEPSASSSACGRRPAADQPRLRGVLRTAAKARQHALVENVWELMRGELRADPPLRPSAFTYNVPMRALAEGGPRARARTREASAAKVLEAFDEATSLASSSTCRRAARAARATSRATGRARSPSSAR